MSEQSKQDVVVGLVKEGIYTRAEIRAKAECTSGAFATYLSGMRNAAKFTGAEICPIEVEQERDGETVKVMTVVTFDEYNRLREEAAANAKSKGPKKTPEQRLEDAEKRVAKCEKAYATAKERLDNDAENEELDLRSQKAAIELKLAEIELKKAQAVIDNSEVEESPEEAEAGDLPSDEDLM